MLVWRRAIFIGPWRSAAGSIRRMKPTIAGHLRISGCYRVWRSCSPWTCSTAPQQMRLDAQFFFASAAAGSAYLTVSETFRWKCGRWPLPMFYAFGTLLGGLSGPLLFGALAGSGQRGFRRYALSAILMIAAAVVELKIGVAAERQPLEAVASRSPRALSICHDELAERHCPGTDDSEFGKSLIPRGCVAAINYEAEAYMRRCSSPARGPGRSAWRWWRRR